MIFVHTDKNRCQLTNMHTKGQVTFFSIVPKKPLPESNNIASDLQFFGKMYTYIQLKRAIQEALINNLELMNRKSKVRKRTSGKQFD